MSRRSRTVWLLVSVLVVGVGAVIAAANGSGGEPRDDDGDGDGGDDGGQTGSATNRPAPSAEPTCDDADVDGRHVIVCTAGDTPDQGLVVALHGRRSSAAEMRAVTELERSAAEAGLAVVYPDALDGGWGDDTFPTPSRPRGDEDLTFLDRLIETMEADPRIGREPVGIVGFSNGASMALRYAAQRPDDVRAVVSVAGQLPRDRSVGPSRPVSLLEIYGSGDPIRGYDTGIPANPGRQAGQPTPTLSTPETVAAFAAALDASHHARPEETDPDPADGTRLRTERWANAEHTVTLLTVVGGGHTWPSAHAALTGGDSYGPVSRDVDAGDLAIAFVLDPGAA